MRSRITVAISAFSKLWTIWEYKESIIKYNFRLLRMIVIPRLLYGLVMVTLNRPKSAKETHIGLRNLGIPETSYPINITYDRLCAIKN